MAKKKKAKVKITSKGMLVSFGYNLRTPAVVDLYPNQIAILKSNGTEFEILSDPNKGEVSEQPKTVTMYRGGLVKAKKSSNKVAEEVAPSVISDTMKKKQRKAKKPMFESSMVTPNDR